MMKNKVLLAFDVLFHIGDSHRSHFIGNLFSTTLLSISELFSSIVIFFIESYDLLCTLSLFDL